MSLQKFCQRPPVTLTPDRSIVDACHVLQEKNVGCLLIEEHGKLCGILTDRDIALKVTAEKRDPQATKVREVMSTNVTTIPVTRTLHDLTTVMHTYHVRRVPIVDGEDKVLGVVTLDDLLILLGQEMSDLSQGISGALFRKPTSAGYDSTPLPLNWIMTYL
ncbi:MAG: CBS domain-containing protein [Deltaproteobacteria bacterium]|jgi:CBS domain-containing protein|nr:CBS domain-containing protein [Deltaproteobacteria bacterium]